MIVDPSAATAAEPGRVTLATPGDTVGKYRLDRVLGMGGMGIVWAAFDPDLERAIAIKLLHTSDEPTLRSRLLREARAMARLKHPNVLTVYEVGTDKNRDYIAMEVVDGGTLDAWLATRPARPEILAALIAAGRGLAAAHAAGLVHRDFKPHNVLRSKDGHVFVTDFGLARGQIDDSAEPPIATPVSPALDVLVSPLTQTGVMIGTPAYMAPEQFAGKIPDARTDQFAFCVTAWEALTGARPFRGETLPELEKAVAAGPANLPSDLPPKLRAILVRGLDPVPAQRWPDLSSLLDALAAAIEPTPTRSRKTPIVAAVAVATLALGGGGVYFATRGSSASAGGDRQKPRCMPAETAFEAAWPRDRRAQVLEDNGEKAMAYVFFLDDLRTRWQQAYAQACREPVTPQSEQRLACLLSVREQTASLTSRLSSKNHVVDMMETISLTSALGACTGKSELPFQESLPDEARDKLEKAGKMIRVMPKRVPPPPPVPEDPDELPDPAAPEPPPTPTP